MGRWATRQRRGGGPGSAPPPTITITAVTIVDFGGGELSFVFSAPVAVGDFVPSDFFMPVLDEGADSIAQGAANEILATNAVGWGSELFVGQGWQYLGSAPDVVSPQSGFIT